MKERIVKLLLVAFTLWPLIQHGLVRRYQVNPWKLGGWAMYAQPHLAPETHLLIVRDGRGYRLDEALYGREITELLNDYTQARNDIGMLAGAPDELGLALLKKHPEEGVLVLVKLRHLNLHTGYIEIDLEQHLYHPDGTVQRGVRTQTEP